jgi:hypothetical protein
MVAVGRWHLGCTSRRAMRKIEKSKSSGSFSDLVHLVRTVSVLGLVGCASGCGQNAHVLGPPQAGTSPGAPVNTRIPGAPPLPGTGEGTIPGTGPAKGGSSCASQFERVLIPSSPGGMGQFVFNLDFSAQGRTEGKKVQVTDAWLALQGSNLPGHGSEGDSVCWLDGIACASLEGQGLSKLPLFALFQAIEPAKRMGEAAGTVGWTLPASWGVQSATLELDLKIDGADCL